MTHNVCTGMNHIGGEQKVGQTDFLSGRVLPREIKEITYALHERHNKH